MENLVREKDPEAQWKAVTAAGVFVTALKMTPERTSQAQDGPEPDGLLHVSRFTFHASRPGFTVAITNASSLRYFFAAASPHPA
jgi:hypothetical protein